MKFKKENTSVYVFLACLLASAGTGAFTRTFVNWLPAAYLLSVLLIAVCCTMLLWLIRKNGDAAHPLRDALLGGAGIYAGALGLTFLINNVLLGALRNTLAACIMVCVFSALTVALAVFAVRAATEKTASRVLVPLVCALLFVPGLLSALSPFLPARYAHPYEERITQTKGLENVSKENRLLINADDSHWWGFWNSLAAAGRFDDESLRQYVLQYADSGVTDLLLNIFCQSSDVPTDVLTFRGDLYGQTGQHGKPVDYGSYAGLNAFYNKEKKDIFEVWLRQCREAGIRPWLSLRMNDCHDPDEAASPLRGELFYTAEENGWTLGEDYGYYRHCLNYAVPEVRRLMLDYTREQLLRYDADGLELDFMREIYCFDYRRADTDGIVEIMNGYLRDTAEIVREAEQKWGHEILLGVRLMRDYEQCRAYGFDPAAWCAEGLVDCITVTPRFSSNDSAMPIAAWKAACPGAEIFAGVETLVNTNKKGCCASADVVRGYGAQYLTAGADGLYLFNYMSSGDVGDREREVYDTCGSLEEILKHPRRHVVTYQDTVPEGWEPYDPLPLKLRAGKPGTVAVETGYIPDGARVDVYVGLDRPLAEDELLTLTLNGGKCAFEGEAEVYGRSENGGADVPQGYCRTDCFIYRFSAGNAAGLPNLQTLTFTGDRRVKVTYLELGVTPD